MVCGYGKNCKGGIERLAYGQLPWNNEKNVCFGIGSGLNPVPPLGSVTSIKLLKLRLFPYYFLMGIIIPTSQGEYEDYYLLSLLLTLYPFFLLLPVCLDPIYRLGTNPIHIPRRPGQALGRQSPVGVASCPPEAPSLVVQLTQTQRSTVHHSPSAVADTQMWWSEAPRWSEESHQCQGWVPSHEQAFNRQMWAWGAYQVTSPL